MDKHGIGFTSQRARNRLVEQLRDMGIRSEPVLEAIAEVPRHLFIDEALASRAYENTALPIGYNQTISQPYIVARMTEAIVESGPHETVLEVGAGCGYQTVILARFFDRVYAVERVGPLALALRDRLHQLNVTRVRVSHRDGLAGWPEFAPYDAILCAASPPEIPQDLLTQLRIGGRLVLPVGSGQRQELTLVTRVSETEFQQLDLEAVTFVPMLEGVT